MALSVPKSFFWLEAVKTAVIPPGKRIIMKMTFRLGIDVVSVLEAKNHSSVLTRDSVSSVHSGDKHRIIKTFLVSTFDQISKEK